MRAAHRLISAQVSKPSCLRPPVFFSLTKSFSSSIFDDKSSGGNWSESFGGGSGSEKFGWDVDSSSSSSWSTGLTAEHFDGEKVGQQANPRPPGQEPPRGGSGYKVGGFDNTQVTNEELLLMKELEEANRKGKAYVDGWGQRLKETNVLMKQIREPGARGSYLKDSEKAEMYKKHKENPEVYTVEKLAKEYRIMRQRVHAILFLKEEEEKEEKKLGHTLDDSVEVLLDMFPEFFNFHDREFHVASLPYKPDFTVMPEGWDGTTRDPDEVHYEISKKEDDMLYHEFVQKFNFNLLKFKGQIPVHKYARRRPDAGWKFTIEKMGPRGKRGNGGGEKFVSVADGSSRPLNDIEKMFVKRETQRRRRKILP